MVNLKSLENSCVSKPVGLLRESVLGVPSDVFLRHTGVRVLAGPRRTEGQTMDEFNKPYFFYFLSQHRPTFYREQITSHYGHLLDENT